MLSSLLFLLICLPPVEYLDGNCIAGDSHLICHNAVTFHLLMYMYMCILYHIHSASCSSDHPPLPLLRYNHHHHIHIHLPPPPPSNPTTTQCKLPECKCGICASGWKKIHAHPFLNTTGYCIKSTYIVMFN